MGGDAVAGGRGEVEALVEDVAPRQARAHEVPGEAEEGGARLSVDSAGAVEELVEERPQFGVIELTPARRGEEVVAADEGDDLGHPREPRGEERGHGEQGLRVGEPDPASIVPYIEGV